MKIAFLGDSITYGYALDNREDRYTTVLCKEMGAEEENFGITGTLMARCGMNRNDGKSFIDRLDLVLDADITVIFGGTNDYFWGETPIGTVDAGEDYFYKAVYEICKRCSERRDVSKTLIVTPYPHNGIGNFYGGDDYNHSSRHNTDEKNFNGHCLEEYCDVLEDIANSFSIPVLNLHKVEGFHWEEHTTDGCHPNPEGHIWLAKVIGDKIKNL